MKYKLVAALLAVTAIAALAGCSSDDDSDTTAAVSPPAAAPTSVAPPAATTAPKPNAARPPGAAGAASDPRCAPASDGVLLAIQSGVTEDGLELTNGTIIEVGGLTYVGATIIDSTGRMVERSDVWIVKDGAVYTSTGGARSHTTFPKASDALGISPGDDAVQAVDTCVVNLTR